MPDITDTPDGPAPASPAALNLRGTSLRQLAALGHLKVGPGLSYSELGRRAGVTAQSMQATLNQLEAHGAVERRTPPGRGRIAQLHLTPAGLATLADAETAIDQISEQVMSTLPPAERQPATLMLFRIFTALTHDQTADRPAAASEEPVT